MFELLALAAHLWAATQPPPAQYDKPYPGMFVQYATPEQIRRYCGSPYALACAYKHREKCTIIVPHGTKRGSIIYRHERAHCHGWSPRH